ncbi:MAG: histidinol dehydrogenase [Chloroflexota bacterium]
MIIIEGFARAKARLSRLKPEISQAVSPALRNRLKSLFATDDPEVAVAKIIAEVRERGDAALRDLTRRIDGIELGSLEVSRQEITGAYQAVSPELVAALKEAAARIRAFYRAQKSLIWEKALAGRTGQLVRPIACVGIYVPGGTAAYPSTALMTAIPARMAGVREVIIVTPPAKSGSVPPSTLVAADIAGVSRVFSIGGAQAVAALAYGTESVPVVDKICGPGNIFVVLAKKLVYGAVDIDGLQGPSELLVIADHTADPVYCAADILAQAEHDVMARVVLVATSRKIADEVAASVKKQLESLPRREIVAASLQNGLIAVVDNLDEAIELANLYAPEHLGLMVAGAADLLDRLTGAGCVFLGGYSSVVTGDYIAGPSHVLPTGGTARFSSPLNIGDFMKLTDLVSIGKAELERLAPAAIVIARAEGLEAHARALEKRLSKK